MPTIDPSLVPCVAPGSLFSRFTVDPTINIRWFVPVDPVTNTVLNRPIADVALRQLILAKTVDALNLRLGHQALFPFLTQAQVSNGTQDIDVPPSWMWDMQVSLPQRWERLRLAKLKRLSGTNSSEYTGYIRLIFTAQEQGSTQEVAVLQADYLINSDLTYQIVRVSVPSSSEEPVVLPDAESETVGGFITFRTLDMTDAGVQAFYEVVSPPDDTSAVDSQGFYTSPRVININDSVPGGSGVTGDYDFVAVSHGTGLLTLSAWNPIPSVDSTVSTWLATFNYPYESTATLQASNATNVTIPAGLFKEFNLTAPAGDEPTSDVSGNFHPVYVNRITREDVTADTLKFWFATFNVESPSLVPIEFASLTLQRSMTRDQRVAIVPEENLFPTKAGDSSWQQGFGEGHVALSDVWGTTTVSDTINSFFDNFLAIIDDPPQAIFTKEATLLSSYGLSRVPQHIPTTGQSEALKGSRDGVSDPKATNRYVVELDQGLGDQVDFATSTQLPEERRENPDIERYGFTGALAHRCVKMVLNTSGENHDYNNDVLPRLTILLGRAPEFGDFWWDGTTLKFFNGDTWVT
jgi:hypothetical protein